MWGLRDRRLGRRTITMTWGRRGHHQVGLCGTRSGGVALCSSGSGLSTLAVCRCGVNGSSWRGDCSLAGGSWGVS